MNGQELVKKAKMVYNVYAVVKDEPLIGPVVVTLWTNQCDAEKYAEAEGLRVISWGVLKLEESPIEVECKYPEKDCIDCDLRVAHQGE